MIINQLDNSQSSNITISLNSLNIVSINNISRTVTIGQALQVFYGSIISSKLSISKSLPDTVRISS